MSITVPVHYSLSRGKENRLKSGTPKGLVTQAHVIPETAFGFSIPLLLNISSL